MHLFRLAPRRERNGRILWCKAAFLDRLSPLIDGFGCCTQRGASQMRWADGGSGRLSETLYGTRLSLSLFISSSLFLCCPQCFSARAKREKENKRERDSLVSYICTMYYFLLFWSGAPFSNPTPFGEFKVSAVAFLCVVKLRVMRV